MVTMNGHNSPVDANTQFPCLGNIIFLGGGTVIGIMNISLAQNQNVTVHGQKWQNYEKNATFYLALPVYRDFYVL